jgi:hypothetical protein
MPDANKVTIRGKEYEVSPLLCKDLKAIDKILVERKGRPEVGGYAVIEIWSPFIVNSIKEKHANFELANLEEATLDEFNKAWAAVVAVSGISIVTKGESKPAESIGQASTAVSAPPSAGPSVM